MDNRKIASLAIAAALVIVVGYAALNLGFFQEPKHLASSVVTQEISPTIVRDVVRDAVESSSTVGTVGLAETDLQEVCWEGATGECVVNAWKWGTGGFTIRLGDEDLDHEIRYLLVKDGLGKVTKVGQLPKSLTYVSSYSDFDGSPMNDSPYRLAEERGTRFPIEVYSVVPIVFGDYRLPVMVKSINPNL